MSYISMRSLSGVRARQLSLPSPGETKPGELAPFRTGYLHLTRGAHVPPGSGAKKASEGYPIEQLKEQRLAAGGATQVARLRHAIAKLETSFSRASPTFLSLGIPDIERRLPGAGLAGGVLHQVIAATYADAPATLGFLFALMSLALQAKPGLA